MSLAFNGTAKASAALGAWDPDTQRPFSVFALIKRTGGADGDQEVVVGFDNGEGTISSPKYWFQLAIRHPPPGEIATAFYDVKWAASRYHPFAPGKQIINEASIGPTTGEYGGTENVWVAVMGVTYSGGGERVYSQKLFDPSTYATKLASTAITTVNLTSGEVHMGDKRNENKGAPYEGEIACVAFWDREISAVEFKRMAMGVEPVFVRTHALRHYWRFSSAYTSEVPAVTEPDLTGRKTTEGAPALTLTGVGRGLHPPLGRRLHAVA